VSENDKNHCLGTKMQLSITFYLIFIYLLQFNDHTITVIFCTKTATVRPTV